MDANFLSGGITRKTLNPIPSPGCISYRKNDYAFVGYALLALKISICRFSLKINFFFVNFILGTIVMLLHQIFANYFLEDALYILLKKIPIFVLNKFIFCVLIYFFILYVLLFF